MMSTVIATVMFHGAVGIWDEVIAGILIPLLAGLALFYTYRMQINNEIDDEPTLTE